MPSLPWFSFAAFCFCIVGILVPTVIYPGIMALVAMMPHRRTLIDPEEWPSVSWIVVARNAEALIAKKIHSCFSVDYSYDKLHVVCFSDGSTDNTKAVMDAVAAEYLGHVTVLHDAAHVGKYTGLTVAAGAAPGEIFVFSDADATVRQGSLKALVRPFVDKNVGGVCGQRVIADAETGLASPQSSYIAFDSRIKTGESRLGRLTSNDGKLYAIRASTFTSVPPGVTDDLFQSLNVIGQGLKFVFAPAAVALIHAPSRSDGHEIRRRRRIVGRSVRAMLNVSSVHRRFGWDPFAVRLLANKGLRRLLPAFLIGLYVFSVFLADDHWVFLVVWLSQTCGWALAAAGCLPIVDLLPGKIKKCLVLAHYVLLGLIGTFLGVLDALFGRTQDKWDPQKRDTANWDSSS